MYGCNSFEWAEPPMPKPCTDIVPFSTCDWLLNCNCTFLRTHQVVTEIHSKRQNSSYLPRKESQGVPTSEASQGGNCGGNGTCKALRQNCYRQRERCRTITSFFLGPLAIPSCMGEQYFNAVNHHTTYACMQVVLLQSLGFKCFMWFPSSFYLDFPRGLLLLEVHLEWDT